MSWLDVPPALNIPLPESITAPIALYEGQGAVNGGAPEQLSVHLRLWPSPDLTVHVPSGGSRQDTVEDGQLRIDGFESTDVLQTLWSSDRREYLLQAIAQNPVKVTALDFWVVNGPEWDGQPIQDGRAIRAARLELAMGDFAFTLDHVNPDTLKTSKDAGHLFAITAVGRVQRQDGAPFATDDADLRHAFDALGWGLSFTKGRWVGSGIFQQAHVGDETWQAAEVNRISRRAPSLNWHRRGDAASLKQVCEALYTTLRDPDWTTTLRTAMGLYIDAHGEGNVASQLISAQVALETLAWTDLTQVRSTKSRRQFKKGHAAVHFTELLLELGISTDLPEVASDLADFLKAEEQKAELGKAEDARKVATQEGAPFEGKSPQVIEPKGEPQAARGPRAITLIRNSYVHPDKAETLANLSDLAAHHAVDLALTYVELSILRLLNVQGRYMSRFKRSPGSVLLPWTPDVSPSP